MKTKEKIAVEKSEARLADKPKVDPKIIKGEQKLTNMIKSGLKKRTILWLRNDLRLHDNYVINYAMRNNPG